MPIIRMKERRLFKRAPIELVISCYLPTEEETMKERLKCYAKDISPKGIRLIVPKKTKVGEEMVLLLEKPIAIVPILVKGRIIWIKKLDESSDKKEAVQIGVEFMHVSTYGNRRLGELVSEVEAKNRTDGKKR